MDLVRGFEKYIEDTDAIMISDYQIDIPDFGIFYVDFDIDMHHILNLKQTEITDEDGEKVMYAETAFVIPYIEDIIEEHNEEIINKVNNYKEEWM